MEDDGLVKKEFHCFRGFIEFTKQLSLFEEQLDETRINKNKIFKKFFETLEARNNLTSTTFKKRKYYLLFIGKNNDIVHCKLAREREYKKDDLIDNKLISFPDRSYPNINVFVDLNSQKFLIESKIEVFENYNTCIEVIQRIMDNSFEPSYSYIVIEPIINESHFWDAYKNNIPVYSIEFKLNSPNLFDGNSDAETVVRESRKNTGSETTTVKFENNKDGLELNEKGIDSFVKYSSSGGGSWKQKIKGTNGKRRIISSKQINEKIELNIEEKIIDGIISHKTLINVIKTFSRIETIEKYK